jgi:hypothetical protein
VLHTDSAHVFADHYQRVIRLTETEVIRREVPNGAGSTDQMRHPWLRGFLREHSSEVDRIFMVDSFDSYFHRDPFEVLSFTDAIAFFAEGWPLARAGANVMWIRNCFGAAAIEKVGGNETLCSGTIYGGTAPMLRFLDLFIEGEYWGQDCIWDQPIVNWMVWTGILARGGVNVKVFGCAGPILTLSNCSRRLVDRGGVAEVVNSDGVIPHVLHQWKAFPEFRKPYLTRCHMSQALGEWDSQNRRLFGWRPPSRA